MNTTHRPATVEEAFNTSYNRAFEEGLKQSSPGTSVRATHRVSTGASRGAMSLPPVRRERGHIEMVNNGPEVIIPGPQQESYNAKRDLIARLTSRVFLGFFVVMFVIVWATISGSVDMDTAINKLLMAASAFGVVEASRDIATTLKGYKPAPAPTRTPSHVD